MEIPLKGLHHISCFYLAPSGKTTSSLWRPGTFSQSQFYCSLNISLISIVPSKDGAQVILLHGDGKQWFRGIGVWRPPRSMSLKCFLFLLKKRFNCVYLCVCAFVFVHLSPHPQRDQKKARVSLTLDEITSSCELFDVGAGTKPLSFERSVSPLYLCAFSSAPCTAFLKEL